MRRTRGEIVRRFGLFVGRAFVVVAAGFFEEVVFVLMLCFAVAVFSGLAELWAGPASV
jgi:hypothetical protein